MIISASRRTDIPSFYSDWFFHRWKEGYALSRNPMNPKQVSRVSLRPEDVDCLVFWSKDSAPMLPGLSALGGVPFYFQCTLNGYGAEVEPGLPALSRRMETLRMLAERWGPERLVVRLDPIFCSDRYPEAFFLEHLDRVLEHLRGCMDQVTFSFLDRYTHIEKRITPLGIHPMGEEKKQRMAAGLSGIAQAYGIRLSTCAEAGDYTGLGITPARCVDVERIEGLRRWPFFAKKDKNQRPACGCAASIDIGAYHTCGLGCLYCYANAGERAVRANRQAHDAAAPLLVGQLGPEDVVRQRQ